MAQRLKRPFYAILLAIFALLPVAARANRPPTRPAVAQAPGRTAMDYGPHSNAWYPIWVGNDNLHALFFVDEDYGWAVGERGNIWLTHNGGQSWHHTLWRTPAQSGEPYSVGPTFAGVQFADRVNGWIVGADGLILHSQDGGESWQQQRIVSHEDLNAVATITARHVWVVGNNGVLARSSDGGTTWQESVIPGHAHLHGLLLSAAGQEAWAVGSNGFIARTEDGGATWTTQHSGGNWLYAIAMNSAGEGWAVGDGGIAYRTTDGGQSWQLAAGGTSQNLRAVTAAGDGTFWLSGAGGTVWHVSGTTWQAFSTGTNQRLEGIAYPGHKVIAVGGQNAFQVSADDGHSWTNPTGGFIAYLSGVAFADVAHGWAVGARPNKHGIVLYTEDGGWSWREQVTGLASGYLNKVSAPDKQHIWIAGQYGGRILHSADGGQSWSFQSGRTVRPINDIQFLDDQRGFATVETAYGQPPAALHTEDGGQNWRVIDLHSMANDLPALSIAVQPDGHGVISVMGGEFAVTDDYFQHWHRRITNQGSPRGEFALAYTGAGEIYGGGISGQIVRSRDNGEHWIQLEGGGGEHAWEWHGMNAAPGNLLIAAGGHCVNYHQAGHIYYCTGFDRGLISTNWKDGRAGAWSDLWDSGTGELRDLAVLPAGDRTGLPGATFYAVAAGDDGYLLAYRGEPTRSYAFLFDQPPTLDGHLDEWALTPGVDLDNQHADGVALGVLPAKDDLSGHLQARWLNDTLYLGAWITDSVAGAADRVQFGLDGLHDGLEGNDDLSFSVYRDGRIRWHSTMTVPVQAAVTTGTTGYQVEVAIPADGWGIPLANQTTLGLTYALWDDDGAGVKVRLTSDSRSADVSNPEYGALTLFGPTVAIQDWTTPWSYSVDTHIRGVNGPDGADWKHRNWFNAGGIEVDGNDRRDALVWFDLSWLPKDLEVRRAQLNLYAVSQARSGSLEIGSYPLLRPWRFDETTWFSATQTVAWGAPGANMTGSDRSEMATDIVTADGAPGWYSWDVSRAVRNWLTDPAHNFGLILKSWTHSNPEYHFISIFTRSGIWVPYHPQLQIEYRLPAPVPPTPTPTPTATATATPTMTPTATPTPVATATPERSQIDGYIWQDDNRNSVRDQGENPLVGVPISLYDAEGLLSGLTTSDDAGYYAFRDLIAGNYGVQVQLPPGYRPTTPTYFVLHAGGGHYRFDVGAYWPAGHVFLPLAIKP